jgi:hypothetical protein
MLKLLSNHTAAQTNFFGDKIFKPQKKNVFFFVQHSRNYWLYGIIEALL